MVDPDLELEDVEVTLDELSERSDEDGEPAWTAYADLDLGLWRGDESRQV